jgi:nuclease HARBI1
MDVEEEDELVACLVARHRRRQALLVHLVRAATQPERPLVPEVRFRLRDVADANCILDFRFDRQGIQRLFVALRLPDVIITPQRDRVPGIEALCMVLFRLTFPKRFHDSMPKFGRSVSSQSRIFLHVIGLLYARWSTLLFCPVGLVKARLVAYCDAVAAKGAPLNCVFGFIDGTKIASCRPGRSSSGLDLQRVVYTGHKRMHCLSYQAVTAPDGLCIHFWGPMEGRRHDAAMLRESGFVEFLDRQGSVFDDRYIYGDPAYGVSHRILSGFKGNLTGKSDMADFNRRMSSVRESVEWTFALLKSLWKFIDCKKQQKILQSPVAQVVAVAMLLTNCHTCYNQGNQISMYFGLSPPRLDDYLTSETAQTTP